MEDVIAFLAERFTDLADRTRGPMKFRLVLQPLMAALFAVRSGLRDARSGQPPYFWALATDPAHRRAMFKDGWKDVGKIFTLAFVLDVIYQVIVLHTVYPGEALVVAFLLAVVPYVIVRGPLNRVVRLWRRIRSTKPDRLSN